MPSIYDIEDPIVQGLVVATCCLSIIGSCLIIFSYLRWKDLQTTSRQLLVFLSLADLLTAAGNLFGSISSDEGTICVIQSAVTTFSSMVSFHWTVYIAWYLYLCMPGISTNPNKILPAFHSAAWGLPLIVVGVALGLGILGPNAVGWCWIDDSMSQTDIIIWGLITGKAWEILSYIATFVVYYVIRRKVRVFSKFASQVNYQGPKAMSKADIKLAMIPLIFITLRIWGTIDFFWSIGRVEVKPIWIQLLQGMGDSAQGFANCILFCVLTDKVRHKFVVMMKCSKSDSGEDQTYSDDEKDARSQESEFLNRRKSDNYSAMEDHA